jgi:hypothetical protein
MKSHKVALFPLYDLNLQSLFDKKMICKSFEYGIFIYYCADLLSISTLFI